MRILPKAGWRYAALLILLFAIATAAVREVLIFVEPPTIASAEDYNTITILIIAITFGFMLIAGAFGLWAIRFSALSESIRSVGTIVDAMDYIHDGVIAIDRRGRIAACNPSAQRVYGAAVAPGRLLSEAFDCLTDDDLGLWMREREPREIERDVGVGEARRTLRFRSYPAHGSVLLLLSDITTMSLDRIRRRQNAYFQLLGHLARGVANDFNELLCGISGHAAILQRDRALPEHLRDAVITLDGCTEKGLRLAGHLSHLAAAERQPGFSTTVKADIERAAALLLDGLDAVWTIRVEVADKLPPIRLNGSQIEQVVYSLGLLASESGGEQKSLWINAGTAFVGSEMVHSESALTILISTCPLAEAVQQRRLPFREPPPEGILDGVVQAILQEAGGTLERADPAPRTIIYRVTLPLTPLDPERASDSETLFPLEIDGYMQGWLVLAAGAGDALRKQCDMLEEAGLVVKRADSLPVALSIVETRGNDLKGLVIESDLLGDASESVLRAIGRLIPQAGVVVLHNSSETPPQPGTPWIRHASIQSGSGPLRRALLDTRTAAIQANR